MITGEMLQNVQFLVDADGRRKAVVMDYSLWEELLTELEDREDAREIEEMRQAGAETIPWEQAKQELRAGGLDV